MFATLTRQSTIQFSSRAISLALGFATIGLTTRALGPAGFGEYTTVVAFLQFVSLVVGLGLGMTVARELGAGTLPEGTVLGNALSLRVISAGIAFAAAPLAALALGYPEKIVGGIGLAAIGFWAQSVGQTLSSVYQVKLKSATLAWLDVTARLLLAAGTLTVVWRGTPNPTAFLIALVATNVVATTLNLAAARRLIPFRWQINRAVWAALWRTTWPVAVTTTLNVIYFKADTVILSLFRPVAEVGQYGTAYAILEALLALPAVIGGLLLPLMSQAQAAGKRLVIVQLFRGGFDVLLALGLAITTGAMLVGKPLVVALAGTYFAPAGSILAVLCLALLCSFVGNAAAYTVFAIGEQRRLIPVFALGAIVGVIAYLTTIPRYSYWGAAWSTVGIEALVNTCIIVVLWRLGITPHYARLARIATATAMLALGLAIPLPLLWRLALGVALWFGTLWLLRLIPRSGELTD